MTGANGYLGNTAVRALDSSDHEVRALVLPGEEPFSLRGAKCEIFYGDVTDNGSLRSPSQFSHEKASRELGYQTRPLEETIADTVGWFRKVERL